MPFLTRSPPCPVAPPACCRLAAAVLAASAWAFPVASGAQRAPASAAQEPAALDGLYTGTLVETWRHPEAHCPWASPRPLLRIAEGRAALRFHEDPPWEATGPVAPGGRIRLEFGRGTEIDVEVVGAVEGTAFRGILRTPTCAFALELVRR
ncbi:hypothetical protein [Caldovatus sediminis]|nr:hypothetical protein [Caldovatus sediminis]